ncbi:uncharacterized protein METZ01_LOCUS517157, partial [marine metagenome]
VTYQTSILLEVFSPLPEQGKGNLILGWVSRLYAFSA